MDIDFSESISLRAVGCDGFTPTHCSNQDCRAKLVKLRKKGFRGITYQCPNQGCFNHFKSIDGWEEITEEVEIKENKIQDKSKDAWHTKYKTDSAFRAEYSKKRLAYYYAHKKEINEKRKSFYHYGKKRIAEVACGLENMQGIGVGGN